MTQKSHSKKTLKKIVSKVKSTSAKRNAETMRQVIIYPGEDSYFVAECPSLPGCVSQGKTKEAAVKNIKEAIEVYVAALMEDGIPVPKENFQAFVIAV